MNNLKIGDIVARKRYGYDIHFRISDIVNKNDTKPIYILKGLFYRIEADSYGEDLVRQEPNNIRFSMQRDMKIAETYFNRNMKREFSYFPFTRPGTIPGKVLHIDADEWFLNECLSRYRRNNIPVYGTIIKENEQPEKIRPYLEKHRPNILVLTGHDSLKKNTDKYDIRNYRNSKYFIKASEIARRYEPNPDRLCIFAGACQSYYEMIMDTGTNFASSPGRILINALDPYFVARIIAVTSSEKIVTPDKVALATTSGRKGIWGIKTIGQLKSN